LFFKNHFYGFKNTKLSLTSLYVCGDGVHGNSFIGGFWSTNRFKTSVDYEQRLH
jgi:hypothetical protein